MFSLRTPCKTLVGGRECAKEVAEDAADVVLHVSHPVTTKGLRDNEKKKQKKNVSFDEVTPDGYLQPVDVKQHAFCCRIKKRRGTNKFDRTRTESWFRTILSDVCPEIAALPILKSGDDDLVKHFFLSRCMNIRHSLDADGDEILRLKTAFRCCAG